MSSDGFSREELEARVLKALARHPSRARAIGMGELFEAVYGEGWRNRINDTRALRKLITDLREEGTPIGSTGDGYYMLTSESELRDYCTRLRDQALRKLVQESRIRKTSLPTLLAEIQLNLGAKGGARA